MADITPRDPRQVAEDISNTIESQDDSIILADSSDQADEAPESKPKPSESSDKPAKPTEVAGYAAADLLEAPVKTPQPTKTEGRDFTENKKVLLIVAAAILLFVIGVIVAVAGALWLGLALAVIAAVLVALGVFLPLH